MTEEIKKVYGIDLGTTYSAISFINEDGKPEIINNCDGDQITASAVYFESAENIIVGETAKEQGKIDSERVVDLIKREMGSDWRRDFDGVEYTPEKISSLILKYLVKGAALAGHDVKDVVITCPAYFGEKERNATRQAGEIAGLNVLQIVDEPIAAALNYGVQNSDSEQDIVVYDLGGGTFDVTVVHIGQSSITVLCSDGNHRLGGANWDERLEALIASKFMDACPAAGDPQEDPDSRYELHNQTEKVKKKLSNATETSIAVSHNGEKAKIVVSREEFEKATRDLLEETIDFTDKMIEFAKTERGVTKISDFLLVGGSTYMPQVMAIVKEKYEAALGVEPKVFEPNYAVSKGAAVFGENRSIQKAYEKVKEQIAQESPNLTLEEIDTQATETLILTLEAQGRSGDDIKTILNKEFKTVASKSYGIRVLNKEGVRVCCNLIKKQTLVPCTQSQKFPVSEDNAATLPLVIYSNNSTAPQEELNICDEVGNAVMELTEGLPKGSLIDVTFELTEEGQLILTARDITNDKEITVKFEVKDGLTREEVEKMRKEVADLTVE